MARRRTLHAKISLSLDVERMSEWAQLLWPLLIVHADDFGRLQGEPELVKARCKPLSPRPPSDFDAALDEMEASGLIFRYEVDGRIYIQIRKWDEHQDGLHKRVRSEFPEPPTPSPELPGTSRNFPELPGSSRVEEKRREVEQEQKHISPNGEKSSTPSAAEDPSPPEAEAVQSHNGRTSIPFAAIVDAWNETCGDVLPQVRQTTEDRRRKIRARVAAAPERRDMDWWREYFGRIRASPFLRGENDRGWRADFDWALRSETVVARVLEGRYHGAGPPKTAFERVRDMLQPMERIDDSGW